MQTSRKTLAWLVGGALGFGCQAAFADYSSYQGMGPNGDSPFLEDYSGGQVGVMQGQSPDYAGYADASGGSAGGWIYVVRPDAPDSGTYVESASEMEQLRRIVAAPGSGLSAGDTVTLSLDVRVDGSFDWFVVDTPSGDVEGGIDVYAYMNIQREQGDGVGEWLGGFDAWVGKSFRADAATQTVTPFGEFEGAYGLGSWSFEDAQGNSIGDALGNPSGLSDIIDTGDLSFNFEARVGDVIMLNGFLAVTGALFSDSTSNGTAWFAMEGDFLNTFSFGISPVTSGVNVAPVPVPAAAWLFASGLLGFVGVARRGK